MGKVGSAERRRFEAREEEGLEMVWGRCGAQREGGLERSGEHDPEETQRAVESAVHERAVRGTMLGSSAGMHSHSITCWWRVTKPAHLMRTYRRQYDACVGTVSEARRVPLDW